MIHLAATAQAGTSRIQMGPIHTGQPRANPFETSRFETRTGLSRLMRRICADLGADRYLLVEPAAERGPKGLRILACNWVYDALEELGGDGILAIIESGHAAGAGEALRALPTPAPFLAVAQRLALVEHGHDALFVRRFCVRGRCVFALFSARHDAAIDPAALARAGMMCAYGLEMHLAATAEGSSLAGVLSERQRECLKWVSEGKTTDEIALILGVSPNTVNSYVAQAIQKFGASNRAMAIATAIRSGVI
jgi:DNA-binding CsgD family transcriptional regulator